MQRERERDEGLTEREGERERGRRWWRWFENGSGKYEVSDGWGFVGFIIIGKVC
jgi:hypothetical protein